MGRLSLLADEHVDRSYVTALRSNGFRVLTAGDGYEPGATDSRLLSVGRDRDAVIITNDDDFVRLGLTESHAGIIAYQQYDHSPKKFVQGITHIDQYFSMSDFRDHVEWLENWL